MHNERGFTLSELLTAIAILGILAALSVNTFKTYRQLAYEAVAYRILHDMEGALAAGRVELDESADLWHVGWSDSGGNVLGDAEAVPGLKLATNTRMFFWHDGWCAPTHLGPGCRNAKCCISEWFEAYHCKSNRVYARYRWNTGEVNTAEFNNWGCF